MTRDEVRKIIADALNDSAVLGIGPIEGRKYAEAVLAAFAARGLIIGELAVGETGERSLDIAIQEFGHMGLALVRVVE